MVEIGKSHRGSAPSSFTYYYPDSHPSFFVGFLGAGRQGAAIVVLSAIDGKLYIRKREYEMVSHRQAAATGEATNALPHSNITQLISQTTFLCPDKKVSAAKPTAELWQFCTGGDLSYLRSIYQDRDEPVPEPFVWRLIAQLLPTVLHLHSNDIAHGDLTPDNIFVNWPDPTVHAVNPSVARPDFLIGDFGCSYKLPPDASAQKLHRVDDIPKAVYRDIGSIGELVYYNMDASPLKKSQYSAELFRVYSTLSTLPRLLQRFRVARAADGEMFARVVEPLMRSVERGLEEADEATPRLDVEKVRPSKKELARGPFGFASQKALLDCPFRPPGPWCVAEVDEKGRLLQVRLGKRYCEGEVMATRKGRELTEDEVGEQWSEACW